MDLRIEVSRYLEWLVSTREAQPATVEAYATTLNKLVPYVADQEITTELLESFVGRPRRGQPTPKAATRNRDTWAIRSFYKWAKQHGCVDSDPSLDMGVATVRNRLPKAIHDDVWVALWDRGMLDEDRAWLGLGYYAGLRREELATVNARLFSVETRELRNFIRKGGGAAELAYGAMAQVVADHLPHLGKRVDEWFDCVAWLVESRWDEQFVMPASGATPNPMSDKAWVNRHLKRVLREAGLPDDSFTPHALRHSCATNLGRCGVPVEVIADLMSHSSIETTRRYFDTGMILRAWRQQRGGSATN